MSEIAEDHSLIDHTSDAGYRAWRDKLRDLLLTGGALVQTTDSGQFTPGAGSRPGTNTFPDRLMLRFDDALQATAPYFFLIETGTGANAALPAIRLGVGTGSNGSGALTGTLEAAAIVSCSGALISTSLAYFSWACGHPGSLGLAFKCRASANNRGLAYLGLHRIRDESGAQTADGLAVVTGTGDSSAIATMRCYRRVSPASWSGTTHCHIPLLPTVSGTPQRAYRHSAVLPEPRTLPESCSVIGAEVAFGSTFPARFVGATDRTYRSLAGVMTGNAAGVAGASDAYAHCMLYDATSL